jgi:hypothetical protein
MNKLISFIAAGETFNDFSDVIKDLANQMLTPLIAIATTLTVLWGVYLGWKFWSAGGDEQKTQNAKKSITYFVIGIFVIFIVAVGAPILIGVLSEWMKNQ